MSHRSHTALSRLPSALHYREWNKHQVLWHGGGLEEVRHIIAKLEHNDLTQKLAQLQKEFNDFHQIVIPIPLAIQSLGPILKA